MNIFKKKLKRINNLDEVPDNVFEYFGIDKDEEDDLTWEEWEEELVDLVKHAVGYNGGDPKKEEIDNLDYYVHTFIIKSIGLVAKTRQYIKEYDVICYEEVYGLFI